MVLCGLFQHTYFPRRRYLADNLDNDLGVPFYCCFSLVLAKLGLMPCLNVTRSNGCGQLLLVPSCMRLRVKRGGGGDLFPLCALHESVVFILAQTYYESWNNHWHLDSVNPIVLASFIALTKDNLKGRLAYQNDQPIKLTLFGRTIGEWSRHIRRHHWHIAMQPC